MNRQQRFAPVGVLAIDPKAFGLIFDCFEQVEPASVDDNGVATVSIRGPLMHHRDFFFDSYESIRSRVADALALKPRCVLLTIDSPGGLVSGAFDAARDLRNMAAVAGVPLHAHVAGQATSAGYAIASAASHIGASRSAILGSIGVIDTLVDATAQNAMFGVNVKLITSGVRKSDGNPNVAVTDEALRASQSRVDLLAGMFFDLVVSHGWGVSVEAIQALQAGLVTGDEAVAKGLASAVMTLEEALAFAASIDSRSTGEAKATEGTRMATPMEDAVASLRKAADGDDEKEAAKAKKMLAAMEGEGDEPAAEGDDDGPAATEGDDDDEKKKNEEAAASGDAHAMAARALAEVHSLRVERENEKQAAKREELLASRPDFAPELVRALAKVDLATVEEMVKTLPRGPVRKDRTAAAATVTGTRGEAQGDVSPRLPPEEKAQLDARMGLGEMISETVHTPNRLSFGVRRPVTAAEQQKGK